MNDPRLNRITIGTESAHIFESDARLHPRWADVQNRWGLLLMTEHRVEDAAAVFRKCLDINPRYAWAATNLVHALGVTGRIDEARKVLEETPPPVPWLRAAAEAFLCLAGEAFGEGLALLDRLDPAVRARMDVRRLEAALARRAGDPAADRLWSELLEVSEVPPSVLGSLLPWTRYGEGGENLLSFVPGLHQLFLAAGRMEARMGKLDEGERMAEVAFACWSERALYLNHLAFVHELRGNDEAAVAMYREASSLAPQDPVPLINLAYYWSAQGEMVQAFEALSSALDRAPRYADLHHQMGLLRRARNEPEDALASFRRALDINPRYAMAHLDLAMTLFSLRSWKEALAAFESVMENGLRSADILLHVGQIHRNLNDRERAEAFFREVVKDRRDNSEARYWLGMVLHDQGRTREARRWWRRFLEENSEPELVGEVERLLIETDAMREDEAA